jgi:hypothetical protein
MQMIGIMLIRIATLKRGVGMSNFSNFNERVDALHLYFNCDKMIVEMWKGTLLGSMTPSSAERFGCRYCRTIGNKLSVILNMLSFTGLTSDQFALVGKILAWWHRDEIEALLSEIKATEAQDAKHHHNEADRELSRKFRTIYVWYRNECQSDLYSLIRAI